MYYVGIDFGTTNSSVAIFNEETMQPEVKRLNAGYGDNFELLKTFLFYVEDHRLSSDHVHGVDNQEDSIFSLKREIMKNPNFTKEIHGKVYTADVLVADFLRHLLENANIEIDLIKRLVLSVPTHYTEELKSIMERAAELVGIEGNLVWFVDEPISVLWDYKDVQIHGDLMLVFDFGGGTLDLAVMRKSENIAGISSAASILLNQEWQHKKGNMKKGKVLAKVGCEIGGDDLDEIIMRQIIAKGKEDGNMVCEKIDLAIFDDETRLTDFRNHKLNIYKRLKHLSEMRKIELTEKEEVVFYIPGLHPKLDREGIKGSITKKEFEESATSVWDGIRKALEKLDKQLIADHKLSLQDIELVLLSGGSSKVPYVMDIIEQLVPNSRIQFDKNLQTSICRGNAAYSFEDGEILVEDNINSAYGIFNHYEKDVITLIKETDAYPFSMKRRIATTRPMQNQIEIIPMVRKGGDFEPLKKDGAPIYYRIDIRPIRECKDLTRLAVTFEIDRSQRLKITAYDNHFKETIGVYEVSVTD